MPFLKRHARIIAIFLGLMVLVNGYLYRSTIMEWFEEDGKYASFVVEDKTTLYVFMDLSKKDTTENQLIQRAVASAGNYYGGEKLIVQMIDKKEVKHSVYEDAFRLTKFPTVVLLDKKGHLVRTYEESIDLTDMKVGLERLIQE